MLPILHCISGLVSPNIDKKVKIYTYDGHSNENLVLAKFDHINRTIRTVTDSSSVVICCYIRYMLKNALEVVRNI